MSDHSQGDGRYYDRADPPGDDPCGYAPPQGLFLLLCVDDQPGLLLT